MHCTLLIPGLLTPGASSETTGDLRLAELEVAFARGDPRVRENISCDQWLCDEFGVSVDGDIPAAPLMLKADGGDPQEDFWFCANPVHLRADRSRLVLSAQIEDLTGDEAIKLVDTLNKHFSQDRVRFLAPTPRHWYIHKEGVPRMLTTPLAHAMNRSVDGHLPKGDDALEWNRIVNEAQMILHAHPVNEAREARGATVVNSIWPWGGGRMPSLKPSDYITVWGGDDFARALGKAANIPDADLPTSGTEWLREPRERSHLIVLNGAADALRAGDIARWREELIRLDQNWVKPLLSAVRAGKISLLRLVACNMEHLIEATLNRAALWRIWRRSRSVTDYVTPA
jgi:hypothetical protein